MSPLAALVFILNIAADALGHLTYKFAAKGTEELETKAYWRHMLLHPWIWIGVGFHTAEFFLWIAFLALVPLSSAVMFGSVNVVVLMLAGRLIYDERISPWRAAGMILICLGITFVGLGE